MNTLKGKILAIDHFRKRDIIIKDWCSVCKFDGETIDHLFILCGVARELLDFMWCLIGMGWVMPKMVQDLLTSWIGSCGKKAHSKLVGNSFLFDVDYLERRNMCNFEGKERLVIQLKSQLVGTYLIGNKLLCFRSRSFSLFVQLVSWSTLFLFLFLFFIF